jgi:hypothetical protein
VGVKIGHNKRGLEKDEACHPHRSRPAEDGQKLLGRDRLNQEEKKGCEKYVRANQDSEPSHRQPLASLRIRRDQQ